MSFTVDCSQILNVTSQTSSKSAILDLQDVDVLSMSTTYSVTTQSAAVVPSASISGNVFTKTAHGLVTGVVGQMTTSSALPTPLVVSTNYYVIRLTANTFSLASSLANALAGTAITLSDAGTGNQTFTPTTASGTLALYESVDGTNFVAVSGDTVTITGSSTTIWHVSPVFSRYMKVLFTPTSGAINFTVTMNARNNTVATNGVTIPVTLGTL